MSEWCERHREDYNLLCGCEGCKKEAEQLNRAAEPILPKEVAEATAAASAENGRLREQIKGLLETIQGIRKDRDFVTTILMAIKKRGYFARGESDEIDAYFARETTNQYGAARDLVYRYLSLSYLTRRKLAEEFDALAGYDAEKDETKRASMVLGYVKDTGRLEAFAARVEQLVPSAVKS